MVDGGNTEDAVSRLPVSEHVFKFEVVKEEDVLRLLMGLDTNKAVRADGLDPRLLRIAAPGISQSLATLFSEQVPSE